MVAIHKPAHDIILKPVVSEKSYALSDRGQYTFVVAPNANKVPEDSWLRCAGRENR